jgi:lysophospholipid acyltransferase (LPLAT)-like uncharacterized protein
VRSGLRYWVGGAVGRAVLNGILATVRFTTVHRERFDRFADRGEPVLYACWHGRLLPVTYYHRREGVGALISQSADGEYIARVAKGWGYDPIRGSTSRGGRAALREVVRRLRAGQSVAMTPDGPRGPRQEAQGGILVAARLAGVPVVPVAAGCSRAWWLGSWDRMCVPKPFSRVLLAYGEPLRVPRAADEAAVRGHTLALENEMNALIDQVDRDVGSDG